MHDETGLEELKNSLRLGCTSFGGPIAHRGYFLIEPVERRGWCSEETYAEIIAVAQSLPGAGQCSGAQVPGDGCAGGGANLSPDG